MGREAQDACFPCFSLLAACCGPVHLDSGKQRLRKKIKLENNKSLNNTPMAAHPANQQASNAKDVVTVTKPKSDRSSHRSTIHNIDCSSHNMQKGWLPGPGHSMYKNSARPRAWGADVKHSNGLYGQNKFRRLLGGIFQISDTIAVLE